MRAGIIGLGLLAIVAASPATSQTLLPALQVYPQQLKADCGSSLLTNVEVEARRQIDAVYLKASSVLVERGMCQKISEIISEAIRKKGMITLYGFDFGPLFKFNGIYDGDGVLRF